MNVCDVLIYNPSIKLMVGEIFRRSRIKKISPRSKISSTFFAGCMGEGDKSFAFEGRTTHRIAISLAAKGRTPAKMTRRKAPLLFRPFDIFHHTSSLWHFSRTEAFGNILESSFQHFKQVKHQIKNKRKPSSQQNRQELSDWDGGLGRRNISRLGIGGHQFKIHQLRVNPYRLGPPTQTKDLTLTSLLIEYP